MFVRILIAGIVGGILVFFMGFVNHMVFGLQGRTLSNVPDGATFTEHLKTHGLKDGLYVFPDMPMAEEQKDSAKMSAANERYKAGPAGMLLIAPTGQDMMNAETLGKEFGSNVLAALLVSWIVSLAGADIGFIRRWLAVLVIGLITWVSLAASYGIWYRFPHAFLHDELFCALIEWGVAGLAIAAIVRRNPVAAVEPKK